MATRLANASDNHEPLATSQILLDEVRRPSPGDAAFMAGLLRLRGFVVEEQDARDVVEGRPGRLSPTTQEHRLLLGMRECLRLTRERALAGMPPDGWFLVDLFKTMTRDLPRFRNIDLRRGPPWDAMLHVSHPTPDQLRFLIDRFDLTHCYRDVAPAFHALHPVRQGFRLLWRFLRIAPFSDFNAIIAWLGMNAWLQTKGYPLLSAHDEDRQFLARLANGPPPTKILPLESRLLSAVGVSD
ncbi:MAG TPA: hypothetical protein VFD82_11880 [Planctomycetota bacterium]|nr:hypothetical protein [Planctomycetota bacterium]